MSVENPNQQNRKQEDKKEREMMETRDGSLVDVTEMSPEEKKEAYNS